MKAARWVVLGEKLAARRIARKLTVEQLAKKAGISERTQRRYESEAGVLGDIDRLGCVAKVLGVPIEAIAQPETAPEPVPLVAREKNDSPYAPPPERAKLVAETQLEKIVALEARLPPPKPVLHEGAQVPVLTAREFQNVLSAFATFEGERFALTGTIVKQRGSSPFEAQTLGARYGTCTRFLFVRKLTDGADIQVTVLTAKPKETRAMQRAFAEEREVCAIARVVLVAEEAYAAGKGFDAFLSPRPLPWGFVVEAVV
jgi:transcriptional regulator with XRE-family HTH domain